jgi:hypothetical protein
MPLARMWLAASGLLDADPAASEESAEDEPIA